VKNPFALFSEFECGVPWTAALAVGKAHQNGSLFYLRMSLKTLRTFSTFGDTTAWQ
jgi:hypothetical protein